MTTPTKEFLVCGKLESTDPSHKESYANEFEIYKTMVSSTGHIVPQDFNIIEDNPGVFSIHDHNYGVRIYVSDSILDDISRFDLSDGFKLIILFAKSNGCHYVDFDSDGPIYESFPKYDW